ncbi:hypothetical protein F2Q69_00002271 [Brassica cretica]|uniref:Uncharacterized protein n=1 Tax=Brassica cretica TaxID=69181 RepID=A0A8S9P7M1_BRACR|nr:hypothetical protein F2Q69_00002271 [Brassica cretica]
MKSEDQIRSTFMIYPSMSNLGFNNNSQRSYSPEKMFRLRYCVIALASSGDAAMFRLRYGVACPGMLNIRFLGCGPPLQCITVLSRQDSAWLNLISASNLIHHF